MEYHKMNNMMNEEMNEENNQNMIYYSFDKELTHIINKEGEFYAFNPTTSINIVDKNYRSTLMLASEEGNNEIVKFLLEKNADRKSVV